MTRLQRCGLAVLFLAAVSAAEDAYRCVRFDALEITEGKLPGVGGEMRWSADARALRDYALLDGPGEAYVWAEEGGALLVRAAAGADVTGTMVLVKPDRSGLARVRFRIPKESPISREDEGRFRTARERHYSALLEARIPGAAWFRHCAGSSAAGRPRPQTTDDLEETADLFTGGRALSESLQLDRELPVAGTEEESVPLDTLPGITIREIDWKPRLEGLDPAKDPLAAGVPSDQFALLFPSFRAMVDLLDAADRSGTPILHSVETRAEDLLTRERCERQLCLATDALARAVGPHVIDAVAFTAGDPDLRGGTDLAILFASREPQALAALLLARRTAAAGASGVEGIETVRGEAGGVEFHGLRSPTRRVCSYQATIPGGVALSNSLLQLERVVEAAAGRTPSLAASPEFAFFRARYPLGAEEETALLVIPDPAIRRWCGPRWRIASSRRERAASMLAEAEVSRIDDVLARASAEGPIGMPFRLVDAGTVDFVSGEARSSIYNTRNFLTPVAEIGMEKVTKEEADLYRRWREGYDRNWSNFFDPIAVRFSVEADRIALDATVMPLILGSDYREWVELALGGKIAPGAGDRHEGALLHAAAAVGPESRLRRQLEGTLPLGASPLAWLGDTITLYLDDDPCLKELREAADPEEWLEENFHRIPVALACDVKDPMKCALFLTTARAFAEVAGSGLFLWESRTHAGQEYVKVSAGPKARGLSKLSIYYVALPDLLVITLGEELLRRAIDRSLARDEAAKAGNPLPAPAPPWLGKHLCLQVSREFLEFLEAARAGPDSTRSRMRLRSWNNLPILNEWKRRYPEADPAAVYERLSGSRLVCPGGGRYVWNETWKTMESTAFGHPGEPKEGPRDLLPFAGWAFGSFGLTFEDDGLRAACELRR